MDKRFVEDLDTAYLLGIYLSKAKLMPTSGKFSVRSLDEGVCSRVKVAAKMLLGIDCEIVASGNFYSVEFTDKRFAAWLVGETKNREEFPSFVYRQEREWWVEFLAGIFDGAGWIKNNRERDDTPHGTPFGWECGISLNNISVMQGISIILNKMRIKNSLRENVKMANRKNITCVIKIKVDSLAESELYFYAYRKDRRLNILRDAYDVRSTT